MRGNGLITTVATLALLAMASTAIAALSFFDIVSDLPVVTGPPYPTACYRTVVAHETSGIFERDGQLALGIRRATDGAGQPLGTDLRASEDHAPGCDFGEDTHFDVTYCADPGGVVFPTEIAVDLLIELTSLGGRPGELVALHPALPITDPGRFFDVLLDGASAKILCHVEFSPGVGHELSFRAVVPEELTLTNAAVVIREQSLGDGQRADPTDVGSYFTANPEGFFNVRLRLEDGAGLEDLSPLLSLTLSGRFLGGTSPVEGTTWGAIKALYN